MKSALSIVGTCAHTCSKRALFSVVAMMLVVSFVGVSLTEQGRLFAAEKADEAETGQAGFFRKNDSDGDKKLTLEEFTAGMVAKRSNAARNRVGKNIEARFKKADTDGDGITDGKKPMNFDQFSAAFTRRATKKAKTKSTEKAQLRFQELDTNGDSFLDVAEFKAGRKAK